MRIFFILLVLFTVVPMVELFILVKIAGGLGAFKAIVLVIVTGIIGAHLARQQGLRTIQNIRGELKSGRLPGAELVEGLIILIAAVVLITPGLLTDILGFLLLLPLCRKGIYLLLLSKLKEKIRSGRITFQGKKKKDHNDEERNDVIDVDFKDLRSDNSNFNGSKE